MVKYLEIVTLSPLLAREHFVPFLSGLRQAGGWSSAVSGSYYNSYLLL